MTKETKQQIKMALDLVDFSKKVCLSPVYWNSQDRKMVHEILLSVNTNEIRKELDLTESPKTYRLKVAVNRRGRLVVIEEFPQDEHHAGLHEMIPDLEDGEYNVEAGIYYADCVVETSMKYHAPSPDDSDNLSITRFEKVES